MARIKKAEVALDGTVMTLAFAHGEELTCNVNDLPQEQKANLLMHGLKQKICDSYSGTKDSPSALERAQSVWQGLIDNSWTIRVAGEGGARVTQLAQALANVTGQPIEVCVEKIAGMDDNQKKAIAAHPEIKLAVATIQAQRAAEAAAAAQAEQSEGGAPSLADMLEGTGEG